jgi:hypothetical protein
MKQNIKNYLKLGILLVGILTIAYSCQKDDTNVPEEEAQIESLKAFNLTSKEIPSHILDFVKTKTNNTFKVNISKREIKLSNSDVNEFNRDTPLGIVQTNKVVQVYNERNTKYTFKVSNPTNAGSVINLVVVDMDGDIIEYFIQYIFDPNSPTPLLSSGAIDMARFTGGMTFYNMEGSVIGNFILTDGDLIDFDGEIDPCPEDEVVEEENDETDDTNNSNSGGGGTQSSDTDNSNDGTSGGNGEIEDPDNPNPCVIGVSYGDCGCGPRGANDGHSQNTESEDNCCNGSPTTFTDTCNGNSFTINNRSISGESSPCDGPVGIIIEDEEGTEISEPCNKIAEQIADEDYIAAKEFLDGKIGEPIEYGKSLNSEGNYEDMVQDPNNGEVMNFEVTSNMVGIVHTHLNDIEELLPNGMLRKVKRPRMFSPYDLRSFLLLLQNANNNDDIEIADVFMDMLSSSGDYSLRFDGDINSVINSLTPELLDYLKGQDAVTDYLEILNESSREAVLLKFIQEKIPALDGVNLYYISNSNTVKRKYLNENGKLKTNKCEQS